MSEKRGPYDKTGREIMIGDVVKVFHYTARMRRERVYMYKHVTGERVWPSGFTCLFFSHLSMKDGDGYYEARDGRVLEDVEIVQSVDAAFKDRPRIVLPTSTVPTNGDDHG